MEFTRFIKEPISIGLVIWITCYLWVNFAILSCLILFTTKRLFNKNIKAKFRGVATTKNNYKE